MEDTADAGAAEAGVFVFWEGTSASYPRGRRLGRERLRHSGRVKSGILWSLRNANAAGPGDIVFNFGLANDLPMSWR